MNKADNSTPQRTIRVEDELWQDARVIANERGENVSDVIRRSLKRYTKRYEAHLAAADQPMTVTYVRRLNEDEIHSHSDVGDQTLWKVTPPVEGWDNGEEGMHSYVVASHNESFYSTGPETLIFPADASGRISSLSELWHNGRGMSVEQALTYAGHTLHADGYELMDYPPRPVPDPIVDDNGVLIEAGSEVAHIVGDYPDGVVVQVDSHTRTGLCVFVEWGDGTKAWHTASAVLVKN